MRTESVHTLILGSGPAGLAAACTLAKAGKNPVLIEKDQSCGGLMKSLRHKGFVVDVGRKELYNRLERVDKFWRELLGDDYRTYPHRGGFLFEGKVYDMNPSFRGFRRGMSWPTFAAVGFDFLWARLTQGGSPPRNVEEYFYRTRGKKLTRLASQGFQEKLTGVKWSEIPMPPQPPDAAGGSFISTVRSALDRAFSKKEVNTFEGIWRHPAKGTGQICDCMLARMESSGGTIHYNATITGIEYAGERVTAVTTEGGSGPVRYEVQFLVSSIPLELLLKLSGKPVPPASQKKGMASTKRTVILVYLFLNQEPKFPHAWLQVTCPTTRIGRITNYSGFNSQMVPPGKGCLCCEYYAFGDDPLLAKSDEELARATESDCIASGLIAKGTCEDVRILRLPGADASQNRDNWMNERRLKLLAELSPYKNLFCVNRTELDIATLAGIESAEAILSGNRSDFDRRVNPAELQIRSESKAFSFDIPVEQTA